MIEMSICPKYKSSRINYLSHCHPVSILFVYFLIMSILTSSSVHALHNNHLTISVQGTRSHNNQTVINLIQDANTTSSPSLLPSLIITPSVTVALNQKHNTRNDGKSKASSKATRTNRSSPDGKLPPPVRKSQLPPRPPGAPNAPAVPLSKPQSIPTVPKSILSRDQTEVISMATSSPAVIVTTPSLIDQEREMRIRIKKKMCEDCHCGNLRFDSIKCKKPLIQLSSIPIFPDENDRVHITEIDIMNQPIVSLNNSALRLYGNLEKISITKCLLSSIEVTALKYNRKLKEIDFSQNQLKYLNWRVFDGLSIIELTLLDNPFTCDCNSKWISRWQHNSALNSNLYEYEKLTCTDELTGEVKPLINVTVPDCDVPIIVTLDPQEINMTESESINITCVAIGNPAPKVSWRHNVDEILESYHVTRTLESIVLPSSALYQGYRPHLPSFASPIISELDEENGLEDVSPKGINLLLGQDPELDRIMASASLIDTITTRFGSNYTKVTEVLTIQNISVFDNGYVSCYAENDVGKAISGAVAQVYGKLLINFNLTELIN